MRPNVDIRQNVLDALDVAGIPPRVKSKLLSTLVRNLQTIPVADLPIEIFAPVVLRRHVIAIPDGDTLHHFVFQIMTNSTSRRVLSVHHRTTTADVL